ncbi:nucleoporin-interacting protein [Paenibacillus chondroitinus]|uniref:Nucleoporin-interacting protein n=1 Tax=Paenibacillus chondroitinus TaxID=59842 RepID=A0ABU6D6C5_9BACL|nr:MULTISPECIES: nucleoporin-interacting protein [Paenibacillus]MCY9657834.1 nucleoporin-interacting protein [Paenibacillus anseongense]MEB4793270.1 nucleoporin-interacting protein [Paenibacillus chondroitinus]
MKHKEVNSLLMLLAIAVLGTVACLSIFYASPYVRTWDEVDFTLALERFDLLAMQPHFPGYPYFILGGWIINLWIHNGLKALSIFNVLAVLSAVLPIFWLARRLSGNGTMSLLLPALVLSSPYLWLMSSRPMSECAGMALLWWFLWSVRYAMERQDSLFRHGLSLMMLGFLMGTRLSFFPFAFALVPLWHSLWQGPRRWRRVGAAALVALLFQLLWVTGLVMSEGTLAGFWKLSLAFVEGHFSEWGGGVISTPMPIWERITQLFFKNLLGSALTGGSTLIAVGFGLLAITAGAGRLLLGKETQSRENHRFIYGLVGCAILYGLWALLGQNIEKPRHIVPLLAPILLLLFVLTARLAERVEAAKQSVVRSMRAVLYSLLVGLIMIQTIYGSALQKRQAVEEPAVYQLHDYVRQIREPFVLFTWEETRVLHYLKADYDHERIYTYAYFQALADSNSGRRVLLTDHVVQGFIQQGKPVEGHLKRIAEFTSEPLFDPAYHDIILYEWVSEKDRKSD